MYDMMQVPIMYFFSIFHWLDLIHGVEGNAHWVSRMPIKSATLNSIHTAAIK